MTDMSAKIGVAVIGLGMAATPHARALRDLSDRLEVRGVYSRDQRRRNAFAHQYEFPPVESLQDLRVDDSISVVLILTPPNARAELVETIASAGKHILMEKPVERTTEAAEAIVRCCDAHGVSLGIVFQHRFREASRKLKTLLVGGSLGALACVRLVVPWWRDQAYYDEPGRGTLARDGGGVLISQAIHSLDLMLSLAGPVAEVQAIAGTSRLHRMETEDFIGAGVRFANGALGSISATTAAYPGGGEHIVFDCERASAELHSGELSIHWHDGRVETFGSSAGTGGGADPMAFSHELHTALIDDFVNSVQQGHPPLVTGREALRVHHLIDSLLASSADRRAVQVQPGA